MKKTELQFLFLDLDSISWSLCEFFILVLLFLVSALVGRGSFPMEINRGSVDLLGKKKSLNVYDCKQLQNGYYECWNEVKLCG